jgi:hypothetical protein
MLNPYVLLGVLIFWLASVTGAYFKGSTAAENKARAAYAATLEQTIAEHNANAVIDMQAAAKVAADEATARTRTAMLRNRTTEVIHEKPMPVSCNLDDGRLQLIAESIAAANNENAPSRVRDAANKAHRAIR